MIGSMARTTITMARISDFLQPDIEAAIRSVLDGADPAWSVFVREAPDSGKWEIGAQPGDGEPFHGELDDRQHSVAAIQQLLQAWFGQYKEWMLDSEE